MNAISDTTNTEKKNYSKRDITGTDPNRYAGFHTAEEAEKLTHPKACNSLIPGVDANISTFERILTTAIGGYLLLNGLTGKKKNITQSIAGATLVARGVSGYCPVYGAMGNAAKIKSSNVNIRTTITIDKPVDEVYDFWRNLENLPLFMKHLDSVKEKDSITSRWTAKGPAGIGKITWDAHILMDERGKMLSWHSAPDSTIENAGKILFKENGTGGTELDVTLSYHAPLGIAGEAAAKLLNPLFERFVKNDIHNLKTFMETGENEKKA